MGSTSRSASLTRPPIQVPTTTRSRLVEYTEQMHSDLPGRCTTTAGTTDCIAGRMLGQGSWLRTARRRMFRDVKSSGQSRRLPSAYPAVTTQAWRRQAPLPRAHHRGPGQGSRHAATAPAGRPEAGSHQVLQPASNSAAGGNLFLPVDETVPGSGVGPAIPGAAGDKFKQNRATIHLHGNNTVWISDGNAHQWITPASEITPYPAGVSARNVPDMGTVATPSGWLRASRRRGAEEQRVHDVLLHQRPERPAAVLP